MSSEKLQLQPLRETLHIDVERFLRRTCAAHVNELPSRLQALRDLVTEIRSNIYAVMPHEAAEPSEGRATFEEGLMRMIFETLEQTRDDMPDSLQEDVDKLLSAYSRVV